MATVLSFSTAKSEVIAKLQASRTAYAATVDGSNRQYNSDTEIANAILIADGEIASLICNTPQHPFQTTFVQTSSALAAPRQPLPARNGMVLGVLMQGFPSTQTFLSSEVSVGNNIVGLSVAHNMITGQPVQLTTSGSLPSGLSLATTYYIIRASSTTYGFATNVWNAFDDTKIDLTTQGSGTNTVTSQYVPATEADNKDDVLDAFQFPHLFTQTAQGSVAGFWFVEGDMLYLSAANANIIYTDYTLTSNPQCPEPYLFGVVAGALTHLYKDGGDMELSAFYGQQYESYKADVVSRSLVLPAISSYKRP